jgi:hypothetical protein
VAAWVAVGTVVVVVAVAADGVEVEVGVEVVAEAGVVAGCAAEDPFCASKTVAEAEKT